MLPIEEVKVHTKDIKSKAFNAPKLNDEHKSYLVGLIAHCYSNAEINEEMYTKFGKTISPALVLQYKKSKRWLPIIKTLREEYEINVPAANMFSKRARLDRLERIYDRAINKDEVDVQLKAVTQGWREVEGKLQDGDTTNVYMSNPVYNQLNLLSNEELMRRHKEATEKLKLIKEK